MDGIGNIANILSMDWRNGLLFIAVLIIIAVWAIQQFDFICQHLGLKTKKMLREEQQDKDIVELKEHTVTTDEKMDKIFECLDEMKESVHGLSDQVKNLDQKNNMNEAARLKDRIAQGYRYFSERGEWTRLDKESMEALIEAYSQYSENSFVHSVVEKELYKWKIIDE